MIEKKWIFPEADRPTDFFENMLARRGVVNEEDLEEFLSPSPVLTYDPFLLKNMKAVTARILKSISLKEKICIYGDYDADGICSVSLVMEIFEKLGADFFYYIPCRFEEGYGLNNEAVERIKQAGARLIITADCGISSAKEVEYAKILGMETIVTDHHKAGEELPQCLIINPKQEDCPYPEKNLSGCGVVFKLAQALQRERPELLGKADLNRVLDLVAIATVGDIVPLLGENRTLAKYGLKTLAEGRRLGLATLMQQIGIKGETLKSEQIGYGIVPHINAAGRMFSADLAVDLLRVKSEPEAQRLAQNLSAHNQDRKNKQNAAFNDALKMLEHRDEAEKFIILELPEAHEGITGIVAGKVKDLYNLPTLIFTPLGQGQLKGTGRSIPGLDLYEILRPYSHMFEKFGGHEGACGLSMDKIHIDELKKALQDRTEELFHENKDLFAYRLLIEGEPDKDTDFWNLARMMEKMEPFGQGNPRPLLALKSAIIEAPFYMGEEGKHVRFTAGGISCIMFGGSEKIRQYYADGQAIDLAGFIEINQWNGEERLQFMVEDIRHSEKG